MTIVDINKLGEREVTSTRMVEEYDKETGVYRLVARNITERFAQPILTEEEARLLDGVEWVKSETHPGNYQCKCQDRRFFITDEIYAALTRKLPKEEPGKKGKGKK